MISLHFHRHLAAASVASTGAQAARYCQLMQGHSCAPVVQLAKRKRCKSVKHADSFSRAFSHNSSSASSCSPPTDASVAAAAAAISAPTAKLDLSTPASATYKAPGQAVGHSPTSPPPKSFRPPMLPQNSSSFFTSTTLPNNIKNFPQKAQSFETAAQATLERTRLLASHFSTSASPANSHQTDTSSIMTSLPISEKGYHSKAPSVYTTRKFGAPNTLEHRVWIERDGIPVSPFHDIPLYANEQQTVLNMVVEVPRWTNAKMEISKEETLNPIKQDTKKGKLRFVRNCFPHKGYLWNYGAFPQTWEDPSATHPETKANGDNDPLDVCEIGELVAKPGEIKQVKVLGVMALLDEGETDWKIIVIDVNDPLAPKLNDVEDVERHLPGLLRATNEWFRIYKIPDGKPENQFAFSGECKNRKYATDIIRECAEAWERLIMGKTQPGDISLANTGLASSPHRTDPAKLNIPRNEDKSPAPIDPSIDKWFYISGQSS